MIGGKKVKRDNIADASCLRSLLDRCS